MSDESKVEIQEHNTENQLRKAIATRQEYKTSDSYCSIY